eukprot:c47119_g1_i1 orf=349-2058(+)
MRGYTRLRAAGDACLFEEDCNRGVLQDGVFRSFVDSFGSSEIGGVDGAAFPLRGVRENCKYRGNGELEDGETHREDANHIDIAPLHERKGGRTNGLMKDGRLQRFSSLQERWPLGCQTDEEAFPKSSKEVRSCRTTLQRAASVREWRELERGNVRGKFKGEAPVEKHFVSDGGDFPDNPIDVAARRSLVMRDPEIKEFLRKSSSLREHTTQQDMKVRNVREFHEGHNSASMFRDQANTTAFPPKDAVFEKRPVLGPGKLSQIRKGNLENLATDHPFSSTQVGKRLQKSVQHGTEEKLRAGELHSQSMAYEHDIFLGVVGSAEKDRDCERELHKTVRLQENADGYSADFGNCDPNKEGARYPAQFYPAASADTPISQNKKKKGRMIQAWRHLFGLEKKIHFPKRLFQPKDVPSEEPWVFRTGNFHQIGRKENMHDEVKDLDFSWNPVDERWQHDRSEKQLAGKLSLSAVGVNEENGEWPVVDSEHKLYKPVQKRGDGDPPESLLRSYTTREERHSFVDICPANYHLDKSGSKKRGEMIQTWRWLFGLERKASSKHKEVSSVHTENEQRIY